jgi:hypothetical protein
MSLGSSTLSSADPLSSTSSSTESSDALTSGSSLARSLITSTPSEPSTASISLWASSGAVAR